MVSLCSLTGLSQLYDQGSGFGNCTFITFLHICSLCVHCVLSEKVLPSIHADPHYPCELVGTWNTWYGEQDQAGKNEHGTKCIHASDRSACELTHDLQESKSLNIN